MNDPYDDSAPFPPEWEQPNEKAPLSPQEAGQLLEVFLSMAPKEVIEGLARKTREQFVENLTQFATLATFAGLCGFERVVIGKDAGPERSHGGFNAAVRVNLNANNLKAAGLTWEEVKEVWDIHMEQFNDFVMSIKRMNIDKGLATED